MGSAQTGTGKTATFVLLMICHLQNNPQSTVLILLPTRELTQQVVEAANAMLGDLRQNKQKPRAKILLNLLRRIKKPKTAPDLIKIRGRLLFSADVPIKKPLKN